MFDILDLDAMTDEVIQADSEKMTNVSITEDGTRINNVRHSTIDRVKGILTANETISIQQKKQYPKESEQYMQFINIYHG